MDTEKAIKVHLQSGFCYKFIMYNELKCITVRMEIYFKDLICKHLNPSKQISSSMIVNEM